MNLGQATNIPKVSIGMPVYNGEEFIREAIDSLLAQTFTDFELIISDNASTDATEAICNDYVSLDNRIRYYRNSYNLGAANNFNRVAQLATGEYFMFAAHDDLWVQNYLSASVALLERHPEAVLCYTNWTIEDCIHHRSFVLSFDSVAPLGSSTVKRYSSVCFRNWNLIYSLIRTSALRRAALMSNHPYAEGIFVASLSLMGDLIKVAGVPLFTKREYKIYKHGVLCILLVNVQYIMRAVLPSEIGIVQKICCVFITFFRYSILQGIRTLCYWPWMNHFLWEQHLRWKNRKQARVQ